MNPHAPISITINNKMNTTLKSLVQFTVALLATMSTTSYAASVTNNSAEVSSLEAKIAALEAKIEAKFEAKINALEEQVSTKIKSDKFLRRRELGTSAWHEAVDDLKDKVEKVTQGMRQLYIEENLATGESRTVYEAGPIKVEASCGAGSLCDNSFGDEVCLVLTLFDANEDLQVFGDIEDDSGLDDSPIVNNILPKNTEYKEEMWDVGFIRRS